MAGVKETQEAIEGMLKLGLVLWRQFSDGFQFADIGDLIDHYRQNPEFVQAMEEAFEGHQKIPKEMEDLDTHEVFQLVAVIMQYIPQILEELKNGGKTIS